MPKKSDPEPTVVTLQWMSVAPDPVQYKPYNPVFSPVELYVQVEVPDQYVLSDEDETVLTPEGAAYVSKQLAKAIMSAHQDQLR